MFEPMPSLLIMSPTTCIEENKRPPPLAKPMLAPHLCKEQHRPMPLDLDHRAVLEPYRPNEATVELGEGSA